MQCPYCNTKIPNKSSLCPYCGRQTKKRRGRLPLSIVAFLVVFLLIHICASNIWEVDENNVLQAPAWYVFFLTGTSALAGILTYRLCGPKKLPKEPTAFVKSLEPDKSGLMSRGNDSIDQTTNHTDELSKTFAPKFSVIANGGEIPELQGDYAKTIFLWATSSSGQVKSDDKYARYITYECGIQHPKVYHEEMIRQGYLEEDSEEKSFMNLKVSELKALASELGISGAGKKAEIITRILSSADKEFIAIHKPVTFSLSEKGKSFLSANDAYIQLHRHNVWGIDWKEYDLRHKTGESFQETIISILNDRAAKDTHLFGRQEYFSMYQLMEESGKKKKAVSYLLQTLYIDVSGVAGMESYNYYKEGIYTKSDLESWFDSNVMIAPGIINTIADYVECYSDSIVEKLYSWKLPVQICSKNLFLNIVHTALTGSFDSDKSTSELRAAYKQFINNL